MVGGASSQFSQVMEMQAASTLNSLERMANMQGAGGHLGRLLGGAITNTIISKSGDSE
jgi:hypothetical protein